MRSMHHTSWVICAGGEEGGPTRFIRCGGYMSFLTWVLLGLLSGFIASKLVNKHGEGVLLDTLLGIVGAVVGGLLFRLLGMRGTTGVNLHSLLVAVAGAVVVLVLYHSFRRAV